MLDSFVRAELGICKKFRENETLLKRMNLISANNNDFKKPMVQLGDTYCTISSFNSVYQ
jgi:hypothetical protein